MTTIIDTDRLILRPWNVADAADAMAIYGDDDVARWLGMGRRDVGRRK